jgi:hypothetical protein
MRIQEIAEELVNLSVQEVNELAMIMNNGGLDMPAIRYEETPNNHTLSPKEYGIKLMDNKRKRR